MRVNLLVMQGPHQGKEIPVTNSPFVIGREPDCQLRPSSGLISRRHCALVIRDTQVLVQDLGSTNGTQVNGQRVRGEQHLRHGDAIRVGPLAFSVLIAAGVAVNKRTPVPPAQAAGNRPVEALLEDLGDHPRPAPGAPPAFDDVPNPNSATVLQMEILPELPGGPPAPGGPAPGKPAAGDPAPSPPSFFGRLWRRRRE
jgi:predicted component of type VI protein secretion system